VSLPFLVPFPVQEGSQDGQQETEQQRPSETIYTKSIHEFSGKQDNAGIYDKKKKTEGQDRYWKSKDNKYRLKQDIQYRQHDGKHKGRPESINMYPRQHGRQAEGYHRGDNDTKKEIHENLFFKLRRK